MLENIAENMASVLLKNKVIDTEDRDVYVFGFEVILSTSITTCALLTLGLILDKILLTLVFIFILSILRIYTGGYHCEKFKSCLTLSTIIYLSELLIVNLVADNLKAKIGVISIIPAAIIIFCLAPVENKNNPLSFEEKKRYRKISRVITLLVLLLTLIGFYTNDELIDFCFITSLTLTVAAILMIIPFLRGGVKND